METSNIIYCFGVLKGDELQTEDFTHPISIMMQAKSEIMESPDVCVVDGDYKSLTCSEMNLNDYNVLYKALVEQSRLLEKLFMNFHDVYDF